MRIYKGGETVGKGTYWRPVDGHQIIVKDVRVLPGDPDSSYLRIPRGWLLILAPVFGLVYVLFLPLFGIGTILVAWLAALIGTLTAISLTGIKICSGIIGRSISFGWTPSSTYLSGKRHRLRKPKDVKPGSNKRIE
jgi:hypothetical protein